MANQKWCVINKATLCESPKGATVTEIYLGALVEVTGRQEDVPMLGKDGQTYTSTWVECVYRNSQGTVAGWVRDEFFDDYVEKFPPPVVEIPAATEEQMGEFPYATKNPNDPAQYLVLGRNSKGEEQVKYNLCAEFCVAFVMGVGIKQFLRDWENSAGSLYKWALGGDSDKTSDLSLVKNMLNPYSYSAANGNIIDFAVTLIGPAFEDKTLSPGRFQKMLQTHSLLAQVVINKNTGKLIPNNETKRANGGINHWIVLESATPNGTDGGRVEIYNPFNNQRQEYSYEYFISSFGGGTYTGCWVKRRSEMVAVKAMDEVASAKKWCIAPGTFRQTPDGVGVLSFMKGAVMESSGATEVKNGKTWIQVKYKSRTGWVRNSVLEDYEDRFSTPEVIIPHPTPEEDDAEQYMFLPGEDGKKRNMCGQLCASFIMNIDVESFVQDWKLKARPYYQVSIAGKNDNGTGIDSLETMFRASPYNAAPGDVFRFELGMKDPVTGILILSAGRMKKMLETHYLVAGVRIRQSDKLTGRLSGQGIGHWVVVD
ncbi:MAG TPA: hypothetical protein PKC52_13380, partial [Anaerolineales bacterium]|nr:hypothetical protein [Anaerolineales bacterium]